MNTIAFNVSNSNYTKLTDKCFSNNNTSFGYKYVKNYRYPDKVVDETAGAFVGGIKCAEQNGKKDQYIEACKNFADKRFNFEPLINAARQKIDALDDLIATKQLNDLIGTLGKNPSEAELIWLDETYNPSPRPISYHHNVYIDEITEKSYTNLGGFAKIWNLVETCTRLEEIVTSTFNERVDKIIENHNERKEAEEIKQWEKQLEETGVLPSTKPEPKPIPKDNCDKPILKFICRILKRFLG